MNIISIICLLSTSVSSFSPPPFSSPNKRISYPKTTSTSQLLATTSSPRGIQDDKGGIQDDKDPLFSTNRRYMTIKTASLLLSSITLSTLSFPLPSNAIGFNTQTQKNINQKLAAYGLPPIDYVPTGFSPLLEVYGRGTNRDALLVQFVHPKDWVVTIPNIGVNGEDGTVQAGQYGKGDSATFYVLEGVKDVRFEGMGDEFLRNAIVKAISQKGDNIYQNFKITNITKKDRGQSGKYAIINFKYDLLTGAGFEVRRRGVASVTCAGGGVQVLWTATIEARYKKVGGDLEDIAESFRCYSDGIQVEKVVNNNDEV